VKIIDRAPYFTGPTAVAVRGERVRVRAYQVIVWVSVNVRQAGDWDPRAPRFPAILDTGNNHNFAIGRGQFLRWAGLHPEALPLSRAVREQSHRVPLHLADVWLHPTRTRTREVREDREPYRLRIDEGIAIYPDEISPRLPLLGLRSLTVSELRLFLDGKHRRVTVSTPWRWWPFG
jgi:hypothetical protein